MPLHGKCPDWHTNPFNGVRSRFAHHSWWTIPDFDPQLGDIKTLWEGSRWDWVLHFSTSARAGDPDAIGRLNAWLEDWSLANPPYLGANWKCGQEASIRVMHLAMATVILDQVDHPLPSLVELIRLHLRRIVPTLRYAIAQNNNHGTSEAAALFIGGTWLERISPDRAAKKWAASGRKWLEDRVKTLVETDGSFSQYSVNYHRVLLDTLSMVEVWRLKLPLPAFSELFASRAKAGAAWLAAFVDLETGDAPNIGANDGARLLPICRTAYRDYRPSVQLASVLLAGAPVYPDGPWNESFKCLGLPVPAAPGLITARSRVFDKGGYAVLRQGGASLYMRYPRFHFRPSHADALHVDLWLGSRNLFRDSGSYSYADDRWNRYFSGTASHNTVQLDGRDQMPRVSRFLFGEWLGSLNVGPLEDSGGVTGFSAGYRDWQGARHDRTVALSADCLRVVDRVQGFKNSAVLRWRLEAGAWHLNGHELRSPGIRMQVTASVAITRMELVVGQESTTYYRLDDLPVLEVEIAAPGTIETTVQWTRARE